MYKREGEYGKSAYLYVDKKGGLDLIRIKGKSSL